MFLSPLRAYNEEPLGPVLFGWKYQPTWRQRLMVFAGMIIVGLAVAALFYLPHVVRGVARVLGSMGQYLLILLLAPVLNHLWKLQRTQWYTLYRDGFVVRFGENKGGEYAHWGIFDRCELVDDGVKLIPRSVFVRRLKLRAASSDRFSAYNVARERISEARAIRLASRRGPYRTQRTLPF